jgi:porin
MCGRAARAWVLGDALAKSRAGSRQANRDACVLAAGCLCLFAAAPALADDPPGRPTGLPEESIASSLPADPRRAALAERGVLYGLNYIGEAYAVTSHGASFNGRLDAYTDIDLEKFAGWKGAAFHANVFFIHGEGASTKHLGNIFAVSNVEALETVRLFEIWIEQSLLEDKVKVRFGQLAADSEFFISDTAAQFLNGTFGWPGITAADQTQGGPAYPLASPGIRIQYTPNDNLTILAAVFNGSPADPNAEDPQRANRHGLDFPLGDPPLLMVEGQYKYDVGLPGTVKLGGWKQFNDDFVDLLTDAPIDGDHGLYAVIDQQIYKGSDDRAVSVFGRISGSPEKQNLIDFYFDTGIVFTGFVPSRPKDSFGAAFGYGSISDRLQERQIVDNLPVIANCEAVLEVNYAAEIMSGWKVIPDFQYIWNPGGRVEDPDDPGHQVENVAVFGVRTNINY